MDLPKRHFATLKKAAESFCGAEVARTTMGQLAKLNLVVKVMSHDGAIHLGWKITDAGRAALDDNM